MAPVLRWAGGRCTVTGASLLEIPFFKQIDHSALKKSYRIVIKPRTTVTCVLGLSEFRIIRKGVTYKVLKKRLSKTFARKK